MHKKRNEKSVTIGLVIILTLSAFMLTFPPAHAADTATRAFLSVNPNPVGVEQLVDVTAILQPIPPMPTDKFHNMMVTIQKPDGTSETVGPLTSSPIGSQYFVYTPTMIGIYKFKFTYPGEAFSTRTYMASESPTVELVVQEQRIEPYSESPLPTDYWTRPINAQHRNWGSIAGNWLMRSYSSQFGTFGEVVGYNPYTQAARAPHVMWTKELNLGGLIGGDYGAFSYYGGQAYEPFLAPPVIMNGRLYYKIYKSGFSGSTGSIGTGFVCADLRTGEEIFRNTQGSITHGQIFNFMSANQMGGIPYLWDIFPLVISGAVPTVIPGSYRLFDAFTGDLLMTFTNALGGDVAYGADGTLFVYTLNNAAGWFSMWNSTKAFERNGFMQGQASGLIQYRPRAGTYNWSSGIEWNVTVPVRSVTTPGYGLNYASQGRRMADNILLAFGGGVTEARLHVAYSMTTGQELWAIDREGPYPQFYAMGEGIYVQLDTVNLVYIAYDLQTGQRLWTSDELDDPWGQYPANSIGGVIADGKLYVTSQGGYIHCFDITDGHKLWSFNAGNSGLDTPYGSWPMGSGPIVVNGVVYCGIGEHSPTNPLFRGGHLFALDANTGTELWRIKGWISIDAIADGYLVGYNLYDNRIYCIGKGPSATEVSVSTKVAAQGQGVLIEGQVTDQSSGQPDTPAIADADMGAYMAYLKQQQPMPTHMTGVPVMLSAHKSDGSTVNIGQVTSDGYGRFEYLWNPEAQDTYKVIASFAGSDSYGSSAAEASLAVTSAEVASSETSATSTVDVIIIVAVVIAILIGLVNLALLSKRKQ